MILNKNYKSVEIDITTYTKKQRDKYISKGMDENIIEKYRKNNRNRFICSICLNKKPSEEDNQNIECCRRKSKSCPICQRNCEKDEINLKQSENQDKRCKQMFNDKVNDGKDVDGKNIYVSQPDVSHGLTLLNEVLTAFQSKKLMDNNKAKERKTVILKDAGVGTDSTDKKCKLCITKTFFYSLEGNELRHENSKFTIINCQPECAKTSQFSIDLFKHKSSSIPQMKLEELKNSLKEKTKSKDAIEEVNRMFATVRKHELHESLDDTNRPLIRNGPRVLPVVKTRADNANICYRQVVQQCRYCQTNYCMSSGDSITKHEYCHNPDKSNECCRKPCCCRNHHCCVNLDKTCETPLKQSPNFCCNGSKGKQNPCSRRD